MPIHFQATITITQQSYPYLPDWYQHKMHMTRVNVTCSRSEEINTSWHYLGM